MLHYPLTWNWTKVGTPLTAGTHYNLDRSRYFYVTLSDLAEPEEPKEISELIYAIFMPEWESNHDGIVKKKQTKAFG